MTKSELLSVWKADPELRAEFAENQEAFFAFAEARAQGRVKILRDTPSPWEKKILSEGLNMGL